MSSPELPRSYRKAQTFLAMAEMLGTLGTCNRAQVGAIIVRDGRCISWGYNGAPPGMQHCEENWHGHKDRALFEDWNTNSQGWLTLIAMEGCRNVTHAESNAVAFAARQGISTEGATLYVSVSPCEVCARLLIAAGIVEVAFAKQYRKDEGILILQAAGVKVLG